MIGTFDSRGRRQGNAIAMNDSSEDEAPYPDFGESGRSVQ